MSLTLPGPADSLHRRHLAAAKQRAASQKFRIVLALLGQEESETQKRSRVELMRVLDIHIIYFSFSMLLNHFED